MVIIEVIYAENRYLLSEMYVQFRGKRINRNNALLEHKNASNHYELITEASITAGALYPFYYSSSVSSPC